MRLHAIAHARAGDKGDTSNISVIALDPAHWELILREVTAERVQAHFAGIVGGEVVRYVLPALQALNFVLPHALKGGVTRSLALDAHGKSLSGLMLELEIGHPTGAPPDGGHLRNP